MTICEDIRLNASAFLTFRDKVSDEVRITFSMRIVSQDQITNVILSKVYFYTKKNHWTLIVCTNTKNIVKECYLWIWLSVCKLFNLLNIKIVA